MRARPSSSTPSPGTASTSTSRPGSGSRHEPQPDEEALLAFLFLLPALVLLGVFVFYPLGRTIWLGLYRGGGFSGEKTYVGVQQYWDVFQSNEFRHSLGVTFLFALITVPAGLAIGLGLAVLADKALRGMHFFRTAFSSTVATSVAVASLIWLVLLQPQVGVLTNILPFEVLKEPGLLQDPTWRCPRRDRQHLGQCRVHVHHHDGRPAGHPP